MINFFQLHFESIRQDMFVYVSTEWGGRVTESLPEVQYDMGLWVSPNLFF